MDYRAALVEFYQKHNPEKLKEIDLLLAKYRGREEELLHALRVKYGVHKAAPPPAQQSPSQLPPEKAAQAQPPVEQQFLQQQPKPSEPLLSNEESLRGEERSIEEQEESPLSSSVYKGRSAAERAAYWKRELEKRERQRANPERESAPKYSNEKRKKEPPSYETEYYEEEDRGSRFPVVPIVIIVLVIALVGAITYIVVSHYKSTSVENKARLTNIAETPKKEGIEPGVVAQNKDSAVEPKTETEFALDNEEEPENSRQTQEEEVPPPKKPEKQAKREAKGESSVERSRDVNYPSESENKEPKEVLRNYWYVSYMSVSQEASAKRAVRELKAEGIENVGYYYIPDYDPRGKNMYKVYIGPYPSVESAERAIDDHLRKLSPGTYAYFLK